MPNTDVRSNGKRTTLAATPQRPRVALPAVQRGKAPPDPASGAKGPFGGKVEERQEKALALFRAGTVTPPRSAGIHLSTPSPRPTSPTHGWGKQSVWLAASGSRTLFCGLTPTPTDRGEREFHRISTRGPLCAGFPAGGGKPPAPRSMNAV